jgi:hypothetical protein
MGVLISNHFKLVDKLQRCSVSDPDHIVPGSNGEAVKKIQEALVKLEKVSFPPNEAGGLNYGEVTINAVISFKSKRGILNFQNKIDNIVGQKTIRQLDKEMKALEKVEPPIPIPPVVGLGGVQIGPMGSRVTIVSDYYRLCGLENIGPGQIEIGSLRSYTTFEGLIDTLLANSEFHQVIVNHGDESVGLLVQLCQESSLRQTGLVIGALAELADLAEKGPLNPNDTDTKLFLGKVMRDAGVLQAVVNRIVQKLVKLRKKSLAIHFRACNFKHDFLARHYKRAFGARIVTFHGTRLLFLRIVPQQFTAGHTVDGELATHPSDATRRFRGFHDSLGEISSMLIGVLDKDGATHVETFTLIEHRSPKEILGWAEALIRKWKVKNPLEFVVPVMWDNSEKTFHCPMESGWREKLRFV